ncbi:MAG: flagellin [Pseudomonadota bacterium]
MTRISEIALQQTLLAGFQRAQEAGQERQIQLSTGKVSDAYSGIGVQTAQLLSAEGVVTRTTAFDGAANAALSRLQAQEGALTSLAETVDALRSTLVASLANGTGDAIGFETETSALRSLSALNASAGGVFVFGGTDGKTPPVAASTLADLAAATDTDALFAEGERARLAVEPGVAVDGGPLAADVGADIIRLLGDIADAETSLGGFSGPLDAAQRDFLTSQVAALEAIAGDIITAQGLNGVSQAQANDALDRNVRARDLAEIVAAEIEDADIAEVVSRLNQDQLAIQASAQALAQASQLSLLNFL